MRVLFALLVLTAGALIAVDDSARFPKPNQVSVKPATAPLMGKSFLPAGHVAHYKEGAKQFDLFLVKETRPGQAAIWLLDYKKSLANPKFVAHFGGFFGTDGGKPVFLFTKGAYLAGIIGLPQAEADALAREFAARL